MKSPASLLPVIEQSIKQSRAHNKKSDQLWAQFGAAVRDERRRRGIELNWFADKIGYSCTMVSYLESGERPWDVRKARLAVKLLSK